jgi:hypothetical protein
VVGSLRVDVAAVEQIARDDYEIYALGYGVPLYDLFPCPVEIARAVRQVISFDP